MERDYYTSLPPEKLRALMLESYQKKLEAQVVTPEDVSLFGSFYYMELAL